MHSQKLKPNLFIVGAARSGTTSLWQYLRQHPNVFMPEDELHKEPAFFSVKGCNIGYKRYLNIFKGVDKMHEWIGEASTAYLTDWTSSKRLHEFNPNAKIIIMLRNPADRAYSLYNWMVQDGYEYAESFEKALELEVERINKKIPNWFEPEYYWNYMYFNSGLYYEQVKRYLQLFRENVLVVKLDDFKMVFDNQYKKICSFLHLSPNEIRPEIHNTSRQVYSARIQFILRKITTEVVVKKLISREYNKVKILNEIAKSFVVNAITFCKAKRTLLDPFSTFLIFVRISRFINETHFDSHNVFSKSQRDVFLKTGFKDTKPTILHDSMRKKLLQRYEEDIVKLQKLLNIHFTEWLI